MYVERYGTGRQTYLALHGWGADHTAFAPLVLHVPACAALYAADLPGCGRSPAPCEWTLAAVADEVSACVSALAGAGDEVTLIGNCGGAVFALLAAQRLKESVQRVVMIDAFAYLPRYFSLFLSENFGRRAYDATFANPIGRWLTNQSLRGRRDAQTDLTASFASADHESARRYLALFAEVGRIAQFANVSATVEIVCGEKSFGAVRKSAVMWREVFPHARSHRLDGVGHTTIAEAAARVSEIVFAPRKQKFEGARARVSESEAMI